MATSTSTPEGPTIKPSQVRVGVYVRIPLGWTDHSFLTSSFLVTSEEQVREIAALGVDVHFDPKKSKVQPKPLAPAVPVNPALDAELAARRAQQEAQMALKRERAQVMAAMRSRLDAVQKSYSSASEQTSQAFTQLRARPEESAAIIRGVAEESTQLLLADPNSTVVMVADKGNNRGEIAHAMSVMTLALLLGKHSGLDEKVLQVVGMGALMHDVGKAGINPSILRNTARNRFEEAIFQGHCRLGHDELRRMGHAIPQGVLDAVLHHHERMDGSGFPSFLRGDEIPLSAQIVAVANRFDNLTNPIDPRTALSPFEALGVMWAREQGLFNNTMLQLFIRAMGIYPPGTLVQLSDSRAGVVVAAAPATARLCPQVLIYDAGTPRREAIIIDLADQRSEPPVKIEHALRVQDRPADELDYLMPRRNMSWFRANA